MDKYSRANLLNEELLATSEKRSFLGNIFYRMNKSSNVQFTLHVPLNVYLRAEIFCEDIEDLSGEHRRFTQGDLVNLLYHDFLIYAKKNPNPTAIHQLLVTLERNSGKDMELVKVSGGSIYNVVHTDKKKNKQNLHVEFRRKLALRGEVMLADLEEVFPNHGYMLEEVLEYLYCDFINKFRKGDHTATIQTILRLLEEEK